MFEDSMIIQNDLDDLIEITSKIANVLDAPGYGGNVSVKTLDGLYIKASGTALREPFQIIHENDSRKASLEIGMHKNSKFKYVLHYHPIYIIPIISNALLDRFSKYNPKIVEYRTPGADLSDCTVGDNKLIFLRNHGVIVQSDSASECSEIIDDLAEYKPKIKYFYCPDDFVMQDNPEQILANAYISLFIKSSNLELDTLGTEQCNKLLTPDEVYRQNLKRTK